MAKQWWMWKVDWMLMRALCLASEPHAPITQHPVMDPVIQYVGNLLELASDAASLCQYENFSIRTVVCA